VAQPGSSTHSTVKRLFEGAARFCPSYKSRTDGVIELVAKRVERIEVLLFIRKEGRRI